MSICLHGFQHWDLSTIALLSPLTSVATGTGVVQVIVCEHWMLMSKVPGGKVRGAHYYTLPW